jgi:hypothetical protein
MQFNMILGCGNPAGALVRTDGSGEGRKDFGFQIRASSCNLSGKR